MTERSGNTRAGKGPSLKGALMVDTVRGSLRIRAWPKPRGIKSEKQQAACDRWRQNHITWRYAPPQITTQWIEATAGTPYYPRDIFTSFNYGRAVWWFDPVYGRNMVTMAFKEDVSQSLDAIIDVPGAMLWRDQTGWRGLLPTNVNEGIFLVDNGEFLEPTFQPVPSGPPAVGYSKVADVVIAAPTPQIIFPGLGTLQDVIVEGIGITASAAGQRAIQLSSDNGASFDTTPANYPVISAAGVETVPGAGAFYAITAQSSAARSFYAPIRQFKDPISKGLDEQAAARWQVYRPEIACNALRVVNISGAGLAGNLTGGRIKVYGR